MDVSISAGVTSGGGNLVPDQRPVNLSTVNIVEIPPAALNQGAITNSGNSIATLVDKLRSDFAFRQSRLEPAASPAGSAAASRNFSNNPKDELQRTMRWAFDSQVTLMKSSIGFHFGLTGVQQSQSGVKTLIEKS